MSPPPIPERLAPLTWRKPAFVWIPLALVLAIGWPCVLFLETPHWQQGAAMIGAATFVGALISLGGAWSLGRPPKARRMVVLHVVIAGAIVLFAAAFLALPRLDFGGVLAIAPAALLVGLPIVLVSAIAFAWVALTPPRRGAVDAARHDVQPFA